MAIKVGSGLVPFSTVVDRFLPTGYRTGLPFAEQLSQVSQVADLHAVGLDYPARFADPAELEQLLSQYGLSLCTLMQEAGDPIALSELLWQQTIRI